MRVTQQALGRHVVGRAEHPARRRESAARVSIEVDDRRLFGQAEVQQLHDAALADEDVGGLHVAMHDALFVCGVEGIGDLDGEVDHFNRRQSGARAARCFNVSPRSISIAMNGCPSNSST